MNYEKHIEGLLDLDGIVMKQPGGYWTKFEAWQTAHTPERPHGIRYSLTFHDRYGERVIGFDNAHAVKSRKKDMDCYDHYHRYPDDEGIPYQFVGVYQLLEDFWKAVDRTLLTLEPEEVGK